ncbi:Slx4p interacting protein [Emydomyces testavorans]|uniref:Slx4p interacting protein n=1 Tax=Emydomyces testavorans TaxID=2070801 RepID=A0AAF0DD15_9EURO|nr:Slx4p interacting protein [Emydomyces testavorans]
MRICPRTGRQAKRSTRPRASLTSVMASLHLLLSSPYFSFWPLEVRVFSAEVYRVWQGCCQHLDNLVPDSINVVVDQFETHQRIEEVKPLDRLDIKNTKLNNYLVKSEFLLDKDETISCGICRQQLNLEDDLIVLCSYEHCNCASHVMCLASSFLQTENSINRIIPVSGECPTCGSLIEWPILMKEMTLRLRGTENKRSRKRNGDSRKSKPESGAFNTGGPSLKSRSNERFDLDSTNRLDRPADGPQSEMEFSNAKRKGPNFYPFESSETCIRNSQPTITKNKPNRPKRRVTVEDPEWADAVIVD